MLVDTPQITWHGGEAGKNAPILSLDTHPLMIPRAREACHKAEQSASSFVVATAGTDAEVRLWIISQPSDEEDEKWNEQGVSGRLQSFVASLGGHDRGVNIVRFSPDGLSLASASDGGTVVIWSVGELGTWRTLTSDRETKKTILRGATEDIYDLTWSPDGKYIACGSIDRRAHVWEVATKRSTATLDDHANYVQGTAWDPLSKYIATQSSDRSCRMYQLGQSGQEGGIKSGRLLVKSCNVIKSCVVMPDDQPCEEAKCVPLVDEEPLHAHLAAGDAHRSSVEGSCAPSDRSAMIDPSPLGDPTTEAHKVDASHSETAPRSVADSTSHSEGTAVDIVDGEDQGMVIGTPPSEMPGRDVATCWEVGQQDGKGADNNPPSTADTAKEKAKPIQRRNLFVDETVTSFFRRLTWSPDGAFLITPTAQTWDATARTTQFCTYLFTRGQFVKPAVCLPGLTKPSVAVRCNPRLFVKDAKDFGDERSEAPMCDLPYRAVFAVVSLDAVVVYDTEHLHPITVATGLHYSGLTDACWSADGLSLLVSSTDGYVSKFHFKPGELGTNIPETSVPLQTRRLHPVIYGWQPEVTGIAVMSPTGTTSPIGLTSTDGCTQDRREVLSYPGTVADNHCAGQEQEIVAGPNVTSTKPKKKIVPTLLTPLPVVSLGHPLQPEVRPESNSAEIVTATSSADGLLERKKRRITPTLVHSNTSCADGVVAPVDHIEEAGSSSPTVGNELVPGSTDTGSPAAGTRQRDRTLKKRLTPTLVSEL